MSILIFAEHDNQNLNPATLHAISAAGKLGGEIHVLVAGVNANAVCAQVAKITGVHKVLYADAPYYSYPLAENIAPLIASLGKNYSHIIATATTTGKDIMPRVAALLDCSQVSDITQIISPDTFIHPIYAGNILETVQMPEETKILTIRQTAFPALNLNNSANVTIENTPPLPDSGLSKFVAIHATKSARPELNSARIIISGGRGMGSKENYQQLEKLADLLGAGLGASRAAVDAGYAPNDNQIGQTGKIVAPELYIAVGISGAIQHLAGMKDSKVIIAINKDENAPIFEVADYGLVSEWQNSLPELQAQLEKLLVK
jgi:electron transfer flavoprotein alpha subunit